MDDRSRQHIKKRKISGKIWSNNKDKLSPTEKKWKPQSESLHRGPMWKNKKKPDLDMRRGENINRKSKNKSFRKRSDM